MKPIKLWEKPMFQDMFKDKVSSMRNLSGDDLMAALGMERRRSWVETLGSHAAILVTGMLLGAGIALLLAPKSGRALRQEMKAKASDIAERIGERAGEAASEIPIAPSLHDGKAHKPLQRHGNAEKSTHRRA